MLGFTAGETMILITTLSTAIVAVITALRTGRVETKVDEVHQLTNSRLTRVETELVQARADLAAAVAAMHAAEQARVTLASEAAARLVTPS